MSFASGGGMVISEIKLDNGFSIFYGNAARQSHPEERMLKEYLATFQLCIDLLASILQLRDLACNCSEVLLERRQKGFQVIQEVDASLREH